MCTQCVPQERRGNYETIDVEQGPVTVMHAIHTTTKKNKHRVIKEAFKSLSHNVSNRFLNTA